MIVKKRQEFFFAENSKCFYEKFYSLEVMKKLTEIFSETSVRILQVLQGFFAFEIKNFSVFIPEFKLL